MVNPVGLHITAWSRCQRWESWSKLNWGD